MKWKSKYLELQSKCKKYEIPRTDRSNVWLTNYMVQDVPSILDTCSPPI